MNLISILDYIGTFAFAISGIRLASTKRFDWFGAFIVGLVTAVGGGTIRDILLGNTPFWMLQSSYLIVTLVALAIFIVMGEVLNKFALSLFLFDAIGLGLFTVVGINKSIDAGFSVWVSIFMGTITGAAGGILRDILINEMPLIFRKDIYAMACIMGGIFFFTLRHFGVNEMTNEILSATLVIVVRLLAVHFHISLPTLNGKG